MNKRGLLPISIIIPVYNEEHFLQSQIDNLCHLLRKRNIFNYEILFIENGSTDNSYAKLCSIQKTIPKLRVLKLQQACYGDAVRNGLEKAKHNYVFQFDIDFIDINFLCRAKALLNKYDIVVGSKLLDASKDKRPFMRIFVTRLLSIFIKTVFNYRGTDTHGIKAYRKTSIAKLIGKVNSQHHFFDTELLLRAQNSKLKIKEIPVETKELRPTRFPASLRIAQAIREIMALFVNSKSILYPDACPLLEADDFGLNRQSILKTHIMDKKKQLCAISILANASYLPPAFSTKTPFSLHINLVEGKPVSDPKDIPSLISRSGNFFSLPQFVFRLFSRQLDVKHLEYEIQAQLYRLQSKGYKIQEINSHQHIHALSPVAQIVEKIAKKNGIINIRQYGRIRHFSLMGRLSYALLKSTALVSSLLWDKKFVMPVSWRREGPKICFMSWENSGLRVWRRIVAEPEMRIIIHPGLPFDRNTQYRLISCKNGSDRTTSKDLIT